MPIVVRPEMTARALQEGTPLRSDVVELPLVTTFKEGKEFFRNAEGRAEGVIDTWFAEVGWDYAELQQVS